MVLVVVDMVQRTTVRETRRCKYLIRAVLIAVKICIWAHMNSILEASRINEPMKLSCA